MGYILVSTEIYVAVYVYYIWHVCSCGWFPGVIKIAQLYNT